MDENKDTNNRLTLDAKIEGFLFWKGEAVSVRDIAKALSAAPADIENSLIALKERLAERGVALIETGGQVELRTSAAMAQIIEKLTKEELDKNLGKAGLETLAIILYEGPISRRDIDYIRGVNSQFIVRNLMVRGLVDRVQVGRGFAYKPTTELLAYLGASSEKDLPEYDSFRKDLEQFKENVAATENENKSEEIEKDTDGTNREEKHETISA